MRLALTFLVWFSTCDLLLARQPAAAFSLDGRAFALLDGKEVRVWDVTIGKEGNRIRLTLAPGEVPRQISYTSNGELLILLGSGRDPNSGQPLSVCIWNLGSGKRSPSIKKVWDWESTVSPKGDMLASDRGLWDVATGRRLREIVLPRGLVCEIVFSPDAKTVLYRITESLAQDFALLFLADMATGKKLMQIGEIDLDKNRAECRYVYHPRFSADGNWVAFVEADQSALHLWDLAKKKAVYRIPLENSEDLLGFTPDSRTLVTWRKARAVVRLWEILTAKELRKVTIRGSIEEVILSPKGNTLALINGNRVEFRGLLP